jgi:hypothetical protein
MSRWLLRIHVAVTMMLLLGVVVVGLLLRHEQQQSFYVGATLALRAVRCGAFPALTPDAMWQARAVLRDALMCEDFVGVVRAVQEGHDGR